MGDYLEKVVGSFPIFLDIRHDVDILVTELQLEQQEPHARISDLASEECAAVERSGAAKSLIG